MARNRTSKHDTNYRLVGIYLTEREIHALNRFCEVENINRSEAVRECIHASLDREFSRCMRVQKRDLNQRF